MSTFTGGTTFVWPDPSPGDSVGGFKLIEKVGQGGMGHVWKAVNLLTSKVHAMKLLPPMLATDPRAWADTLRNFQLASQLNHQHICPLQALERDPKWGPFLVMAFIAGMPLDEFRKTRPPMAADEVAARLRPVAEALDYAHSRGIIHCDVKDENIVLETVDHGITVTGTFVIDFGIAAQVRSTVSNYSQHDVPLGGTIRYMAPEIWRGRPPVQQTDQYSLAVIAYRLLSGVYPFDGPDRGLMREAVLNEPVEPLEGVENVVNTTLQRGLAKAPKDRFPSCVAFVEGLHGSPGTTVFPSAGPAVEPRVFIKGRGGYPTLQSAIEAAHAGDELVLEPGVFREAVTIEKSLTIRSREPKEASVLTAADAVIVKIAGPVTVSLRNLVMKSTSSDLNATKAQPAISVHAESASPPSVQLQIVECHILGEVTCEYSRLLVTGCTIAGASFVSAAGDEGFQMKGIDASWSELKLSKVVVTNFEEGIYSYRSSLVAEDLQLRRCHQGIHHSRERFQLSDFESHGCSTALYLTDLPSMAEIKDGRLVSEAGGGTGISIANGEASIENVSCDGFLNGLRARRASVTASNCTFRRASSNGVAATGESTIRLDNCTITGCRVGAKSDDTSSMRTERCTFRDNKVDTQ